MVKLTEDVKNLIRSAVPNPVRSSQDHPLVNFLQGLVDRVNEIEAKEVKTAEAPEDSSEVQ